MTLQAAKSIARHLGLTLRQVRSGNYRVNFRDGTDGLVHGQSRRRRSCDGTVQSFWDAALTRKVTEMSGRILRYINRHAQCCDVLGTLERETVKLYWYRRNPNDTILAFIGKRSPNVHCEPCTSCPDFTKA
jgi:hypothetical protein